MNIPFLPRRFGYAERTQWLRLERACLRAHQANLESLRAWKNGDASLQEKWTDEMNRRMNEHERLLSEWEKKNK